MKVCLVSGQFPPDINGGAENYVLRIAQELKRRNHTVTILTTKPYDGLSSLKIEAGNYKGIKTLRFFPINKSHLSKGTGSDIISKAVWHVINIANPHSAIMAKRAINRLNPDIIHTNNLSGISPSIIPAISNSQAQHIHTVHDYDLICPKGNLLREFTAPGDSVAVCKEPPLPCRSYSSIKRNLIRKPDIVTSPSQHVIDIHQKQGIFKDVPTYCLRLGIDQETITDVPSRDKEAPNVLYVGNINKQKGIEVVLKAAEDLSNIGFHICGSGPMDNDVRKKEKRNSNINFHGYVSESKLSRLRQKAWLAIVPSIWMDNSPFVIYESFAKGLPVIGSDIGGIPELIRTNENGALFKPGDSEDLIEKILEILQSPSIDSMGQNAIDWAKDHTINQHIRKLERKIYNPYSY